jgi:hypothetical protein
MIVNNLNSVRLTIEPFEYDPPLIVDADRMEAAEVALQFFQPI